MSYLLDTNIISERIKKSPNPSLIQWFDSVPIESLYLSVLTIGEIKKGIESISDQKKKAKLLHWVEHDLIDLFKDRILSIDLDISIKWGLLCSQIKRTLPTTDSLIASTAIINNLKLVTRNTKDFNDYLNLELVNPF